MKLAGHTALVTGGAVRIGRALCIALAAEGCRVAIHVNRSVDAAEDLERTIIAEGGSAWVVQGGLDSEADAEAVFEKARREAGRVDLLVNNAAVFHKENLFEASGSSLAAEIGINLVAPMTMIRAFAQALEGDGSGDAPVGRIVNILDRRITSDDPSCLPYLLSKKMLAQVTRSAALELAPRISVNGVAPGAILPPPGEGAGYLEEKAGPVPLQCRCTPEHVAACTLFLLRSDVMTGQVLFVDGGQHLLG